MTWRHRGLTLKVGHIALQVVPSRDGRDRWLVVAFNATRYAFSAPRWLSFMRDDGRIRGGC
jgi:hypothetical protein